MSKHILNLFAEIKTDLSAFTIEEREVLKPIALLLIGFVILASTTSLGAAFAVYLVVWGNNLASKIK